MLWLVGDDCRKQCLESCHIHSFAVQYSGKKPGSGPELIRTIRGILMWFDKTWLKGQLLSQIRTEERLFFCDAWLFTFNQYCYHC